MIAVGLVGEREKPFHFGRGLVTEPHQRFERVSMSCGWHERPSSSSLAGGDASFTPPPAHGNAGWCREDLRGAGHQRSSGDRSRSGLVKPSSSVALKAARRMGPGRDARGGRVLRSLGTRSSEQTDLWYRRNQIEPL